MRAQVKLMDTFSKGTQNTISSLALQRGLEQLRLICSYKMMEVLAGGAILGREEGTF